MRTWTSRNQYKCVFITKRKNNNKKRKKKNQNKTQYPILLGGRRYQRNGFMTEEAVEQNATSIGTNDRRLTLTESLRRKQQPNNNAVPVSRCKENRCETECPHSAAFTLKAEYFFLSAWVQDRRCSFSSCSLFIYLFFLLGNSICTPANFHSQMTACACFRFQCACFSNGRGCHRYSCGEFSNINLELVVKFIPLRL